MDEGSTGVDAFDINVEVLNSFESSEVVAKGATIQGRKFICTHWLLWLKIYFLLNKSLFIFDDFKDLCSVNILI